MSDRLPARLFRLVKTGTGTLIAFVIAGAAIVGGSQLIAQNAEVPPKTRDLPTAQVQTGTITLQDGYTVTSFYTGRIEPQRTVRPAFEAGGTLSEVLVDEGDRVRAGDIIARQDIRALQAERRALVAARDALVAQRDLAALTTERQEELNARSFASAQRFDEARLTLAQLEAELARQAAAIDALDIALSKAEIVAPFDADVGTRFLDPGVPVAGGQAVVELRERGETLFRVGLPEDMAKALTAETELTVTVAGTDVRARLVRARQDVDPATRTISVLVALDEAEALPSGTLGALSLPRQMDGFGAWVPISALSEGISGLWTLLIVQDDGTTRREPVEVLHSDDRRAFVAGELAEGKTFIRTGTHRLTGGQRVVSSGS